MEANTPSPDEFESWYTPGLPDHLTAPDAREKLYADLCLLRDRPDQVLTLARACAWSGLTEDERYELAAQGELTQALDTQDISAQRLIALLTGANTPNQVDKDIADALLRIAVQLNTSQPGPSEHLATHAWDAATKHPRKP